MTEYVPRSEADLADRVRNIVSRRQRGSTGAAETAATAATTPDPEVSLPPSLADSFDAIAGSISDAIVTIDAESEIVYASEGLSTLTGYERSELVGDDFVKLVPEHLRRAHREGLERYLQSGERTLDWSPLRPTLPSESDVSRHSGPTTKRSMN